MTIQPDDFSQVQLLLAVKPSLELAAKVQQWLWAILVVLIQAVMVVSCAFIFHDGRGNVLEPNRFMHEAMRLLSPLMPHSQRTTAC